MSATDTQNLYDVLGVPEEATFEQIATARRALLARWHPDRNPDNLGEATERSKRINHAYDILSDANLRAAYDRDLAAMRSGTPGGDEAVDRWWEPEPGSPVVQTAASAGAVFTLRAAGGAPPVVGASVKDVGQRVDRVLAGKRGREEGLQRAMPALGRTRPLYGISSIVGVLLHFFGLGAIYWLRMYNRTQMQVHAVYAGVCGLVIFAAVPGMEGLGVLAWVAGIGCLFYEVMRLRDPADFQAPGKTP